ncbi:hypothetical protein FBY58_1163 [Zymomonas mobilis]|uniref:Major facilitator superfamily (MFS) profile domain-containing protein n=1 Tax=Zymomonas mobilis TaxID=542 RepID=A0A542W1V5_ZYMMB|nr:MFS transporter [Zymomonas mobilis]TQL17571.1 hypothetical protein FBY58_1163 [Zymomonas mobilis]
MPSIATDLFRSKIFTLSVATAFLAFMAAGLIFAGLPLLLYEKLVSHSAALFFIPWSVAAFLMAFFAGDLRRYCSAAMLESIGLVCLGCGISLIAFIPTHAQPIYIIVAMAIAGGGFGLAQYSNQHILIESTPATRSQEARRILKISHLLGMIIGGLLVFAFYLYIPTKNGAEIVLSLGALMAFLASVMSFSRLLKLAHS